MKNKMPILLTLLASPVLAENARQLEAHEHGVGTLNIAVDGAVVAMEFHAPGADIVGFEYEAESAEDRAAIEDAIATLSKPLDLFQVPEAANCSVTQASAELESEEDHGAHDDHDEHEREDHAEHDDHEEHEEHDEHGHDEHSEHDDHGDHDHEEHAEEASHTEFHAEYALTCEDLGAITSMSFPYFDTFENARELEVQIVSASGAQAFEVERSSPELDLSGMF
ncbi:zinc uptake protein ZrgA [Roseovarius albus]|nr:DUF2796 domain-containing protein [Roseovarius albus]